MPLRSAGPMYAHPPEALEELAAFFREMAVTATIAEVRSRLLALADNLETQAQTQRQQQEIVP